MTPSPLNRQFPQLDFSRPWTLLRPAPFAAAQAGVDYETDLLRRVGHDQQSLICFTRLPRCLVVTRREARMDHFAQARAQLECADLPLAIRASGGSCVPQGPGMVNLSLVFPRLKDWTLEMGYELICALFAQLLADYGLRAASGEVKGSFCDGRYNLQIGGRKILGTAQRWAGGNRRQAAILIHGCLLVDLDLETATANANRFYQLCGQEPHFRADACTSLARELGGTGTDQNLHAEAETRLYRRLAEHFNIRG